jgi:hypothetical protein
MCLIFTVLSPLLDAMNAGHVVVQNVPGYFGLLVIAATPRKRCPKAGFCFSDFATITVQRSYSTNQPHFKPQFDHSCLG